MATPGNSGRTKGDSGRGDPAQYNTSAHYNSSGRSNGGTPRGAGAAGGLSDRWSDDDGHRAAGAQTYDMTLPDEDKATLQMASPLIRHDSMRDVEGGGGGMSGGNMIGGGSMMNGDEAGLTVSAGRGAQEFGAKSSAPKDVRDHVKAVIAQNKELVQPSVVRNLVVTYSITVFVVIILSIAGQVAVNIYIDNSFNDAVVINVSGRQRMLSQLVTKDALALAFLEANPSNGSSPNATYFLNELQTKFKLWNASNYALYHGGNQATPNLPALPGTGDGAILALHDQQTPHFDAMVEAVQNILKIATIGNLTTNSSDYQLLADEVNVLLANEGPFWHAQDNITLLFQDNANSHLQFVLILSWVLHALVILTLILEGLFVFWPVARSMQRLIDERFSLIRRSLESEAENRGVSILMMGYISHELQLPLATLTEHLDNSRDYLRSLEAFSSGPSSNLPTAAASTSGMIEGEAPSAEPLRGALSEIEKARLCCELLSTVSGDITNLRNIELGRMALVVEVVDVADVIQQVLSTLAPKVPEGVQLKVEVAPSIEEEKRRLDKHRLQQVLLNLVDNAFRSTSEGEVIVRALEGKTGGTILFEVQDSGEGLTEEQRMSLYEPVMDSSGLQQGNTNLALYVVKLLVDLQNGKFGVDLVPGGGNLHWVELPAVTGGATALSKVNPAMPAVTETVEKHSGRTNSSSGRVVPENVPSSGMSTSATSRMDP